MQVEDDLCLFKSLVIGMAKHDNENQFKRYIKVSDPKQQRMLVRHAEELHKTIVGDVDILKLERCTSSQDSLNLVLGLFEVKFPAFSVRVMNGLCEVVRRPTPPCAGPTLPEGSGHDKIINVLFDLGRAMLC